MKARELAEILMQHPDYEVVIRPDELRADFMGCPYEQTIDCVKETIMPSIPVVGQYYLQINCKNHFVSERGYKL